MTSMPELLAFVFFGLFAVMLAVGILDRIAAACRHRDALDSGLPPAPPPPLTTFSAGFSLRRPDSVLRERYNRKIRPQGRTCEINKFKDDPYDP